MWTKDIILNVYGVFLYVVVSRYSGHVNSKYNIDACISSSDTHIFSGSEDGFIYIWNLIDVSLSRLFDMFLLLFLSSCPQLHQFGNL